MAEILYRCLLGHVFAWHDKAEPAKCLSCDSKTLTKLNATRLRD